ncbi:MAG TPA: response regulator, partial [Terriglobales bacterium]|nr:response regulator [Terriglobales bacterium]
LDLAGHQVLTAYDGDDGVQLAERERPDVVLLDLGMPKMNGYDACRHLRRQRWAQRVTIVALTGWGQEDDRRKSREAGFDDHLIKPVDPHHLSAILAQAAARLIPAMAV